MKHYQGESTVMIQAMVAKKHEKYLKYNMHKLTEESSCKD